MKPFESNPFEVLGLAPTLDLEAVKRAYFERLKRCPPHLDPTGFTALRTSYEPLSTPEGLARAFAQAPLDLAAALARRRAELKERIDSGRARLAEQAEMRELKAAFIAAMAGLK